MVDFRYDHVVTVAIAVVTVFVTILANILGGDRFLDFAMDILVDQPSYKYIFQ